MGFDVYDGTEGCAVLSEAVGVPETDGKTTKLVVGMMARSGLVEKHFSKSKSAKGDNSKTI